MAAAAMAVIKKRAHDEHSHDDAPAGSPAMPKAHAPAQALGSQEGKKKSIFDSLRCMEGKLPKQELVKSIYTNNYVQIFVAIAIMVNFFVTVAEKEIDPFKEEAQFYRGTWVAFDVFFTILFTIELVINIYGSFFLAFWASGWNVFDFVIVLISVLATAGVLTGPLKILKIFRAFRVFRLFKRIKALNKIITALVKAIPGVLNAFIIMVLIMSIFAIIGVTEFAEFGLMDGENKFYTEQMAIHDDGTSRSIVVTNTSIDSITMRGFFYGQEYFGTFSRALFTLFQVLTGESWAEMVARPLIFGYSHGGLASFGTSLYFCFYIVLMQIVLVNVVVAVLLDKFVEDGPEKEGEEEEELEVGDGASGVAPGPEGVPPLVSPNLTTAAPAKADGGSARSNSGVMLAKLQADVTSIQSKLDGLAALNDNVAALGAKLDALLAAQGTSGPGAKAPGSAASPSGYRA